MASVSGAVAIEEEDENMQRKKQLIRSLWLIILTALMCAGGLVATAQERAKPISLGILGYNYTNESIDSFSINGQGGGNISVSSPTSGGSGIVCCFIYRPGSTLKIVRIRWQSGVCYFSKQSSLSKLTRDKFHLFYKEKEAPVEVLASTDAKYMEVHFYPDGSIRAAVTAEISSPRLNLDAQRDEQAFYPRCPDDREPAQ